MAGVGFIINIAVLIPVLAWILGDRAGAEEALGPDTPGRRILTCLYGAILAASVMGLAGLLAGRDVRAPAQTLFALQIAYKLATVFAVGLGNPVVNANLLIAVTLGGVLVAMAAVG